MSTDDIGIDPTIFIANITSMIKVRNAIALLIANFFSDNISNKQFALCAGYPLKNAGRV